jgi:hypothetical protein
MDVLIVLVFLVFLASLQINRWQASDPTIPSGFLWTLYATHLVLSLVYLGYAYVNRSDSNNYYEVTQQAESWSELWKTGTSFIHFLCWPFVHLFNLSYVSCMMVFAHMGFTACGYFYLSVNEQTSFLPKMMGRFSWKELVFLLPNIHFWSASIGKGPVMFLAIALFIYGLSRFNRRILFIIGGLFLAFMVRPHIAFVLVGGTAVGSLFAGRGIPWYVKFGIGGVAIAASFFLFQESVEFTQVGDDNSLEAFLAHRTAELSKAGSGVDMSNYNMFMKLFTFWFRPLFVDAPGALGLFVSFENALYLFMLYQIIVIGYKYWRKLNGWYKSAMFIFILGSIILAQVSGNLGIAMRQKAQLMPLFFFVFVKIKEYQYRHQVMGMPVRAGLA